MAPKNLRESLEQALTENPDDLAAHMAYGDYLSEQGDPKGEFIQVQLALEDSRRSSKERGRLQKREKELLQTHKTAWLGEAADLFLAKDDPYKAAAERFGLTTYRTEGGYNATFVRGWIDSLELDRCNPELIEALGRCPTMRLIRNVTIYENDYDGGSVLPALAQWSCLGNVRRLQVGPESNCHMNGEGATEAIEKMPRLEELYLYAHATPVHRVFALSMPNLRTLHVYHLHEYPLEILANNASLHNLISLACWPHGLEPGDDGAYIGLSDFRALVNSPHLRSLTHLALYLTDIGDEGIQALIQSGMLKQLRVLDLWNGRITDEGARALAACPDIRRLEKLRLAWNGLTSAGIAALVATGVNLEAEGQHNEASLRDMAHLWEGDCE